MVQKFKTHLNKNFPELNSAKLLIAVSGGVDSMVLAKLCHQLQLNYSIAHCNFNLREASVQDQDFVVNYAVKRQVDYFVRQFETHKYAKQHNLSTQVAARNLRYHWFDELINTHQFDYLLTAHHLNDNLETFLINLSRGSGIKGLTAIPDKNSYIRRPLLIFSKVELLSFAKQNKITWREDESNASNAYLRNQIRHQIVPELEQLSPHFLDAFMGSLQHLKTASILLSDYVQLIKNEVFKTQSDVSIIYLNRLKKYPNYLESLFYLLSDFNFTAWDDIKHLVNAETGKKISSESHLLVKNRDELRLYNRKIKDEFKPLQFNSLEELVKASQPYFKATVEGFKMPKSANQVCININQLKFPLILRSINTNDTFTPFGMKGKKKVLQFLCDLKVPTLEKQKQLVFEDQNHIVWLVKKRLDHHFKVTENQNKCLKITWLN